MLKRKIWRSLGVLGLPFIIEILESLNQGPRRFVDLKKECPNDKTRANRLKGLRKNGFITTVILEVREQNFIHYCITEKGKKALKLLLQLEELSKKQ